MKKENVMRPKKYKKGQEEKTAWLSVGTITEFDSGGKILELNDRDTVYQIFPFDREKTSEKLEQTEQTEQPIKSEDLGEVMEDELRADQIPF